MKVQFFTICVPKVPDAIGGQALANMIKRVLEKNLRIADFKAREIGVLWADEQNQQEAK